MNIEFKNSPEEFRFVAAYLHHGENRIRATFLWQDDCVRYCEDHGDNIHGRRIYTPMTRDGRFLEAKANGHGYNIVDSLRNAGKL